MKWIGDPAVQDGVRVARFELDVAEDRVPGLLFTPEGRTGPRPVVLYGHGGGSSKEGGAEVGVLRSIVRDLGYVVASVDQPGFGDRLPEGEPPVVENIRAFMHSSSDDRARVIEPSISMTWVARAAKTSWTCGLFSLSKGRMNVEGMVRQAATVVW